MAKQRNPNERLLRILQASPEEQTAIDRILDGKASVRSEPPTGPLLMGMSEAAKDPKYKQSNALEDCPC